MKWITRIILLTILPLSLSLKCDIDNRNLPLLWEQKLHEQLELDHKRQNAPSCNTEVKVHFKMKYFKLDSSDDIFTMYSWISLTWTDKRLAWNTSDFGGIDKTYFWRYDFWSPELRLINIEGDIDFSSIVCVCKVDHTGSVICVPRVNEGVQCVTNLTSWPYDTQKCTLEYGIVKDQKRVHLSPRFTRAVSMIGAEYGAEWTIVDYEQKENVSETVHLSMTFTLERNGGPLGAILVFPSILLSLLTCTSLLLDVNNNNRLFITMFAILCHFFYMSGIGWTIPKHSPDPPSILLFFRFSIVWNMILLVLNVVLSKLRNKETVPPPWVGTVKNVVFESHGNYFVWPRWEVQDNLLSSAAVKKDVEVWDGFANIVNSVFLFVSVIVYSILMPLFIPRPPPFN